LIPLKTSLLWFCPSRILSLSEVRNWVLRTSRPLESSLSRPSRICNFGRPGGIKWVRRTRGTLKHSRRRQCRIFGRPEDCKAQQPFETSFSRRPSPILGRPGGRN
jgi:hypothetical protein